MKKFTRRKVMTTMAFAFGGSTLVACSSTQGATTSRVRLYSSVAEMAQDSDEVVAVRVASQRTARDVTPETDFTLTEVEPILAKRASVIGRLIVRQLGSAVQAAPVPLMETGKFYLLFLTLSGLPGELAAQYYVTGSNAGLFIAGESGSRAATVTTSTKFNQVLSTPGEKIPNQLVWSDI